jgi:hypothetical protein
LDVSESLEISALALWLAVTWFGTLVVEWGTRLAVLNSQDGVALPPESAPMPQRNWGPPGGPWQG